MTFNVVMQRAALAQWHLDQVALGRLGRLADGFWHLAGLAVAEAHAALLIAHHDECGEAETAATLDHLGHAIDVHELVDELAVALLAISALRASAPFAIHGLDPLEI